ncbi:hypothetical protein C8R47DRAFT_115222 [Mycena vitilis]|nr:hypothetical protein C8R47DRAFT_115222 [Mycena vitilis]
MSKCKSQIHRDPARKRRHPFPPSGFCRRECAIVPNGTDHRTILDTPRHDQPHPDPARGGRHHSSPASAVRFRRPLPSRDKACARQRARSYTAPLSPRPAPPRPRTTPSAAVRRAREGACNRVPVSASHHPPFAIRIRRPPSVGARRRARDDCERPPKSDTPTASPLRPWRTLSAVCHPFPPSTLRRREAVCARCSARLRRGRGKGCF